MEETLTIKKSALNDLIRIKDEFDSIVESIELSEDKEFMTSFKKSKEQVKKRDFSNWNDL